MNKTKTVLIGIMTGLINGLFGSGGGTIIVPFLERILLFDPHKAHATAIAVILPLSVVSIIIYSRGDIQNIIPIIEISFGGIIGGFIGAKILNKISSNALRKIFAIFMIIAGVKMIL